MDHIAHIKSTDGAVQMVSAHCRAVSEQARAYGNEVVCGNIAALQGLLHDVGKLSEQFDQYIAGKSHYKRGEIDHSFAGARYLDELVSASGRKDLREVAALIKRTIISHHGLHDWINDEGIDYCKQRIEKTDRYEEIRQNAAELFPADKVCNLLEQAAAEYTAVEQKLQQLADQNPKEKRRTAYAFYLGLWERFMESILMDADRTDTADFMSGIETKTSYDTQLLWMRMERNMEQKIADFRKKTDHISQKRMDISDRCHAFADHPVGVCRLIVPTGGGKTLSALRFAIAYCQKHQMNRIIYTAPFMSILEQNSDEIRSIAGEDAFLEHHSDMVAKLDDADAEELSTYELHTERWDSPVIATTMVQFLNALFSGKTSCVRRMHRICRSVIIIDEIQSLPLKCVNLFNLAINFLTKVCGCAVILCSATQPPLEHMEYPLLMDEQESMTGDYTADFEAFQRTALISTCLTPYGYTYEEAADFCEEKLQHNGNLLLIVNTKAAAATLYLLLQKRLEGNALVVHLSTNLCPEHRRDRLQTVRDCLNAHKPVICVTTQLIEAGVDISFRCVVRSLAGLDHAAQAAGRCNRHGEAEQICPVYFIRLRDEQLGSMTDIRDEQGIVDGMLHYAKDEDLLAPEKLAEYYKKRYSVDPKMLSYPYPPESTTLLSLLSLNKDWYHMVPPKTLSPYCVQAFKTAGSAFQVIDSNTVDVIVPYHDEAKTIIKELDTEHDPKAWKTLLRKAQKYTVGIYQGTNQKLAENHAIRILQSGVLALDEASYHSELGVITEDSYHELLMS